MSKNSKPRDRWSQVFTSARDRAGVCKGCGYYLAANDEHRADCMIAYPKTGDTAAWHAEYLERVATTPKGDSSA